MQQDNEQTGEQRGCQQPLIFGKPSMDANFDFSGGNQLVKYVDGGLDGRSGEGQVRLPAAGLIARSRRRPGSERQETNGRPVNRSV